MPPVSLNIGAMRNSGGLFNTNSGGSSGGVNVNPLPPRAESQNRTSGFSFNNTVTGGLLNYNFGTTASAARQQHPPSPGVAAMVAKRQAKKEREGLQG